MALADMSAKNVFLSDGFPLFSKVIQWSYWCAGLEIIKFSTDSYPVNEYILVYVGMSFRRSDGLMVYLVQIILTTHGSLPNFI